jgi:hypothetical protein
MDFKAAFVIGWSVLLRLSVVMKARLQNHGATAPSPANPGCILEELPTGKAVLLRQGAPRLRAG